MTNLKIILTPASNKWFIQNEHGWYALEQPTEVETALTVLPLSIVDEFSVIDQQPFKGNATVHSVENGQLIIEGRDVVGNKEFSTTVEIDESCLCSIEWQEPPFSDGWVKDHALVFVDNVESYELRVYLPPLEGKDSKVVTVENRTSGESTQYTLTRGCENTLSLIDQRFDSKQEILLRCEKEPLANSRDTRELGFVVVDEVYCA